MWDSPIACEARGHIRLHQQQQPTTPKHHEKRWIATPGSLLLNSLQGPLQYAKQKKNKSRSIVALERQIELFQCEFLWIIIHKYFHLNVCFVFVLYPEANYRGYLFEETTSCSKAEMDFQFCLFSFHFFPHGMGLCVCSGGSWGQENRLYRSCPAVKESYKFHMCYSSSTQRVALWIFEF